MPTPFDNAALYGPGSCGCHQQVLSPYALPDGTEPLIVLDFKNGVYMANGATVTLGDLLVENTDYGNFFPADIVPGTGLYPNANNHSQDLFTLTGDALALVLSGSTALYSYSFADTDAGAGMTVEMMIFPDFVPYYVSQIGAGVLSYVADDADSTNQIIEGAGFPLGAHKSATTFIDGKISRSTDGNAIITINPAIALSPAPDFYGVQVQRDVVLEKIALYPPQLDADLPALSANGNPINSVAPAVTGVAQEGHTLSCSTGTWANTPTGYAYQWYRGPFVLAGATSATYDAIVDDVGSALSCLVTATNATGGGSAVSNSTDPVIEA